MRRFLLGLVVVIVGLALAFVALRRTIERQAILLLTEDYATEARPLSPVFDGPDATLARIEVNLEPIASDLFGITDVQFPPGGPGLVVAQKSGDLTYVLEGEPQLIAHLDVLTDAEQGLLGIAFDPDFHRTGRLWVHTVEAADGEDRTRVRPLQLDPADPWSAPATVGPPILELAQPYQNHNGGQIAFGPDGQLYLGLGDGGLRDDPLGAGPDPHNWLGTVLRITPTADGYTVPSDNPFADGERGAPEVWASGLRNPWRFSWLADGRMVVADVGQDTWEELSIAGPGDDLGWSHHEGTACFPPGAECVEGSVLPFHTYGRASGQSITGGYEATGDAVPAIRGRYVFGDFVSGRIWAIRPGEGPVSLGRWPLLIAAFGRDAAGDLVVADHAGGTVYRLAQ
ncbi:MAG: glucose/arabinose dehydrogenase [Myxococcota bacterium]|jgi:glucose/arabinose dehydrogenase